MKQNEIFVTKKYEIFKSIPGNRDVKEAHVRALVVSMEKKYVPVPIIINSKYEVIDGQHRLQAASRLGLPVHFIMRNNFGLEEVQILNENQKVWNPKDIAQMHIELGNPHYQDFVNFTEKYGFNAQTSIILLSGLTIGNDGLKEFKAGELKIKSYASACMWAEKLKDIGEFYKGYKKRSFIYAMCRILKSKEYDHKVFLHKLKGYPSLMVDCVDTETYLKTIEDVYNYKNRNKVRLY